MRKKVKDAYSLSLALKPCDVGRDQCCNSFLSLKLGPGFDEPKKLLKLVFSPGNIGPFAKFCIWKEKLEPSVHALCFLGNTAGVTLRIQFI